MSDIFFRGNHAGQGWYYKYKNKVSGPYQSEREANDSFIVRLLDTKPQRGRSDSNTAKP